MTFDENENMIDRCRVLDFTNNEAMITALNAVRDHLGSDCEIYGVGFSLGANHLLRYLGSHHHDHGMKAAVSISNPFDVLATTVRLKYRCFGLYDKVIRIKLADPFLQ